MNVNANNILDGNEAIAIAAWLGCAFFLAAGVNQIWKLFERMKDKPPPSEVLQRVQAEVRAVETKCAPISVVAQVRAIETKVEALRSDVHTATEHQTRHIESKIEESRKERQVEVATLHEKINKVDRCTAQLETATLEQNRWLHSIMDKINSLIRPQ